MSKRILFTDNKDYYASYDDKAKRILFYCSDIVIADVSVLNVSNIDKFVKSKFESLQKKNGDFIEPIFFHEELISDYQESPNKENERMLKIFLFLLQKMSSINKKIYRVNSIIGRISDLGVCIDKDFNPFESEV